MIPRINPREMQKAMQRMGIKHEEIDAEEVIIKSKEKEIIVKEPQVLKVNMMGQDTFQVSGIIEERTVSKITEDDIKTVMDQAKVSREKAIQSLEESEGDLAAAIINLK